MRSTEFQLRLSPAAVVLGAAAAAAILMSLAPAAHARFLAACPVTSPRGCQTPTPTPQPTPTPTNAFISLDVTAGGPNTVITVNGGAFLPNEQMTLYWDPPANKVAGGAVADSSGNFVTHIKPFPGDPPAVHRLCASVQPYPCANFSLEGTPTPTPSESPSPFESPSPSPTAGPSPSPSPTPVVVALNGFDVITKPPFVFLPIIGGLGLVAVLVYWVLSSRRTPAAPTLPAAAVVHRATRPDYSAGFGTPAPIPAQPVTPPPAWADVPPPVAPPEPPPGAAGEPPPPPISSAPSEPPVPAPSPFDEPRPPQTGHAAQSPPDEPPDLPEPGD